MRGSDPHDELLEHLPAMRAFAISLTRNPTTADDVVQDAIEKAWTNFRQFKPGSNMRAWLFTILRNTYFSNRRKTKREVPDIDSIHANRLAEKPAHDGRLQLGDFRWAFAQLSDDQREALLLVGALGFSYDEAAEMCAVPIGTIKSRVGRARHRLADLMQLEEDDALEMTDDATLSVLTTAKAIAL